MTDRIKKIIAVTIAAILVFTGCGSESAELESLEEGTTTTSAAAADETTTTAKATETEETQNVPKPEETSTDKVEETTTSAITTAAPVVTTTTTAATTTQAPVTTTTTTVTTTKPVETTAPAYDCKRDGHKYVATTITSEPMWCREMHTVTDFGFDLTLAERHFPNVAVLDVYSDSLMKNISVPGDIGSASTEVEVWGTKTYEVGVCTVCGDGNDRIPSTGYTINPIGEWQFINGINQTMVNDAGLDFNTLFYDPYNIPQSVLANIKLFWELW